MKKNRNVGYHIKEGFRGIFQHGLMSFAAVCVTVACLLMMGSFVLVMENLDRMVGNLEQQNQVLVYIDETYTEAEAKSVGSAINLLPNVSKAEFVSKEQALDAFVEEQDDPDIFSGLSADTLRHRFVVTLADSAQMKATVENLEGISGVVKVNAHMQVAKGFMTIRNVLQIVFVAVIAGLLIISLFIISNTIRLAMYARKEEIAIMKIVGATNGFIRIPFVIEGGIIGLISAAVAFFGEWGLYDVITEKISQVDTLRLFTEIPFQDVIFGMGAAYLAAGLLIGIFGSMMSIRKFLNV